MAQAVRAGVKTADSTYIASIFLVICPSGHVENKLGLFEIKFL